MLKGEGKIHDGLIEKLMGWRHSGFGDYAGNHIARDDRDGQRTLAQYILRNVFSDQTESFKAVFYNPMVGGVWAVN